MAGAAAQRIEDVSITVHARHRRKDGSIFPVQVSNTYVRYEGEEFFFASVIDISAQEGYAQALRNSEAKLNSIFQAAPIGIGVLKNRVFEQVNDQFCSMLGYSRAELIGQSARIIYPTDEDFDFVGREKYRQIAAGWIWFCGNLFSTQGWANPAN